MNFKQAWKYGKRGFFCGLIGLSIAIITTIANGKTTKWAWILWGGVVVFLFGLTMWVGHIEAKRRGDG